MACEICPDVSLFAASGSPSGSFYIVCEADQVPGYTSCNPTDPNTQFLGVGGTSASSPAFAGIMALVNQQVPTPHGQGNAKLCPLQTGSGAECRIVQFHKRVGIHLRVQ